jgi:hypothetical protein
MLEHRYSKWALIVHAFTLMIPSNKNFIILQIISTYRISLHIVGMSVWTICKMFAFESHPCLIPSSFTSMMGTIKFLNVLFPPARCLKKGIFYFIPERKLFTSWSCDHSRRWAINGKVARPFISPERFQGPATRNSMIRPWIHWFDTRIEKMRNIVERSAVSSVEFRWVLISGETRYRTYSKFKNICLHSQFDSKLYFNSGCDL